MVMVERYSPVGVCIYCGSKGGIDGLRDEHIVPFSLSGEAVLPKASCRSCEAITSAFEGRCARTMYGSFRIREGIRTRRPKQRPDKLVMRNTLGADLLVPVDGVVSTLPWVHFRTAGFFRNPQKKEAGWTGTRLEVKTAKPKNGALFRALPPSSYSVNQSFDVDSLARTLAKIAHATCVGVFGLDGFRPWLPPYILGSDTALSHVVGGHDGPLLPANVLHEISYEVAEHQGQWLVTTNIRLFAQVGGPHAKIIVGEANEKTIRLNAVES
jgi:hypothetical protein